MWLEFVSAKRAERSQWVGGSCCCWLWGWRKAADFPEKNKKNKKTLQASASHTSLSYESIYESRVQQQKYGKKRKTHLFTVLYLAQPGSVCRLQRCSLNRQLWFESRLMQSQAGVGCSCAQSCFCFCSLGGIVHFLRAQRQERRKASTFPASQCVPEFRGQKVLLLGDWQQLYVKVDWVAKVPLSKVPNPETCQTACACVLCVL